MTREERQMQWAVEILQTYRPPLPFHLHLKSFFRQHRQFGSRDRRLYSDLCYSYFRTGHNWLEQPMEEKLVLSLFLLQPQQERFLGHWLPLVASRLVGEEQQERPVKLQLLTEHFGFSEKTLFPWEELVSPELDLSVFRQSLLEVPLVWVRVQKGQQETVLNEAKEQQLRVVQQEGQALAFAPGTPLQELRSWKDGLIQIQDWASQETGRFIQAEANQKWWDVCAGAGGKTLMLLDQHPQVELWSSDIRKSILQNLESRAQRLRHRPHQLRHVDATKPLPHSLPQFDGIVVDAPCSGSGTWGRNPEWLVHFQPEKLEEFQRLQKQIVLNVKQQLKPGGELVYLTCSVFSKEDEEVEEALQEQGLTLLEKQMIPGSKCGADTMFAARFSS